VGAHEEGRGKEVHYSTALFSEFGQGCHNTQRSKGIQPLKREMNKIQNQMNEKQKETITD
jgi:DNA-binding transcriptional regulator GbsR (MarR family)